MRFKIAFILLLILLTATFAGCNNDPNDPTDGDNEITSDGDDETTPDGDDETTPDGDEETTPDGDEETTPDGDDEQEQDISVTAKNLQITIDEDNETDITLEIEEPNEATFALKTNPEHGNVTIVNNTANYTPNANFNGQDSFTYTASISGVESDPATVTITITPVNDPPEASVFSFSVDEGDIYNGDLSSNASDVDNDDLTFSIGEAPTKIYAVALTINADGTFQYIHNGEEQNFDERYFKVCDSSNECVTQKISITVNEINDSPIASSNAYNMNEGGTLNEDLKNLVSDADSEHLAFSVVDGKNVTNGTLNLNVNGSFTYTHNGTETTSDSFDYQICDDFTPSACDTATITITISLVNDAPNAADFNVNTVEGATYNGDLNEVVSDPDSTTLTFSKVSSKKIDTTLTINTDGTFILKHDGSETFSYTFKYQVCDDSNACSTGNINVTVQPADDPPTASDFNFSVDEGGTYNGNLNDVVSDPDSTELTFTESNLKVPATSITINEDGTFTFVHDGSENFSYSYSYRVCDNQNACSYADINVTVNPVNDRPQVQQDSFTVDEGGTYNGDVSSLVSDDDSGNFTFSKNEDTLPANGYVTINANGTFTYKHNGGETTGDAFNYKVCDDATPPACNAAQISITVNPVNDAPKASDYDFSVDEGGTYNGDLKDTTIDVDSTSLTFSEVTQKLPAVSITINPNGTFSFVHNGLEDFSFTYIYKVCDDAETPACDTANINVTVNPVNDRPQVQQDSFDVDEGGTHNGDVSSLVSDDDSENLTFSKNEDTLPVNGYVTINANGTFTYKHNGGETTGDAFNYKVCDDATPPACNAAQISITVNPVNDAPKASDYDFSVDEGGTYNGDLKDTTIDVDSTSLTFSEVAQKLPAVSITINQDGTFSFVHNGSEDFSFTYIYKVCDDAETPACDTANINVTVNPINDSPQVQQDSFTVDEGGTYNGDVSSLVSDDDSENLTFSKNEDTLPANGYVIINANGTFTYKHNGGETTGDAFNYKVCDDATPPACNAAQISITVNPVNDPPTANDHIGYNSADEGGSCINGLVNYFTDPDSVNFTYTVIEGGDPQYGILNLQSTGVYQYTHDGSETTSDTFTFKVCDDAPTPACDTATVTIKINPVDDSPTLALDEYDATGNTALSVNAENGILSNDTDVDTTLSAITQTDAATTLGGLITINADGSFEYFPPAGIRNVTDSYTYGVEDSTETETIKFNISENIVWYVNNTAPADGDGRSTYGGDDFAFDTLAEASSAVQAGDLIVLYGTNTQYTSAITLPENANLVGTGVTLPNANYPKANFPNLNLIPLTSGTVPQINVTGSAITLRGNNVVMGIDVSASINGIQWSPDNTTVGDIFIDTVNMTGAQNYAISIENTLALAGSVNIFNSQISDCWNGIYLWNIAAVNIDANNPQMTISVTQGNALNIGTIGLGVTNSQIYLSDIFSTDGSRPVFLSSIQGTFNVSNSVSLTSPVYEAFYIEDSTANIAVESLTVNQRQAEGIWINNSSGLIEFGTVNIMNSDNSEGHAVYYSSSDSDLTIQTLNIDSSIETTSSTDTDANNIPDDLTAGDGDCVWVYQVDGSLSVLGGTINNCQDDGFDIRNSANVTIKDVTIGSIGQSAGGSMTSNGIYIYNLTDTANIQNTTINNWDNEANSAGFMQIQVDQDFTDTIIKSCTFEHDGGSNGLHAMRYISRGTVNGDFTITGTETAQTTCSGLNMGNCLSVQAGNNGGSGSLNLTVEYAEFTDSSNGRMLTSIDGTTSLDLLVDHSTFGNLGKLVTTELGSVGVWAGASSTLSVNVTNSLIYGDETLANNGYGLRGISIETGSDVGDSLTSLNVNISNNTIYALAHAGVAVKIEGDHLQNGSVGTINITDNSIGTTSKVGRDWDYGLAVVLSDTEKYCNVSISGNTITSDEHLQTAFFDISGNAHAYFSIEGNTFIHPGSTIYSEFLMQTNDAGSVACAEIGISSTNTCSANGGASGFFTLEKNSGSFTKNLGTNTGTFSYGGTTVDDGVCSAY